MTFPSTSATFARALASRGYEQATAVQVAVLQADAAGRDLLVSAQTGSGKTVAFGLAIAPTLLGDEERFAPAAAPLALIIAPTRELALQVQRELVWLYAETGARVITCVGGMDVRAEARQLAIGAHIVVGTPGRLRDHLERKRLDLSQLKSIVLDEADEMLDLGFREDLEFILDATPASRRTLLFSATIPREIETLARRYQRDAVRLATVRRDEPHADIEYRAVRVAAHDVDHAVVNVLRLHEARAALVFCATREAVKRMLARLVERGFSAVALSGELSQAERTHALQALRDGRARVLVATDVAARGLDLPDLALVIHADLPNNGETLVHRSGRTGRAGRKGLCVLIVPHSRRRRAETLLVAAKLRATWGPAPTADEIRARDQERFLADAIFTEGPTEEDLALARVLQGARSAEEIALALVRVHRARLPAPEDLAEDPGPPRRAEDKGAGRWAERRDRDKPRDGTARPAGGKFDRPTYETIAARAERASNREMVWFRLSFGRDRDADPKWLLPLICTAGNVTKADVGAIKIAERDTRFQIAADCADQFAASVRANGSKQGQISRAEGPAPLSHSAGAAVAADRHVEGAPEKATAPPPAEPAARPGRVRREVGKPPAGKRPHRKGAATYQARAQAPVARPAAPETQKPAHAKLRSKYAAKKKSREALTAKT